MTGRRTKVWVGLQVSLHGANEVPAGQEDKDGAGHLQCLDVLEESLHQLEGRLLLVDLRHGASGLRRVLGATDGIAVCLRRQDGTGQRENTEDPSRLGRHDGDSRRPRRPPRLCPSSCGPWEGG